MSMDFFSYTVILIMIIALFITLGLLFNAVVHSKNRDVTE